MNAQELRKLTNRELGEKLAEAKEELFNLRFQLATNQLDNTARLGTVRRDVARLQTVMRQQELEAWSAQEAAAEVEATDGAGRRQKTRQMSAGRRQESSQKTAGRRQESRQNKERRGLRRRREGA